MKQETLKMSHKERERLVVMRRCQRGEILLKEAAWEMRLSPRQAIRVKQRFEAQGAFGLTHRSRDRASNRAHDPEVRRRANVMLSTMVGALMIARALGPTERSDELLRDVVEAVESRRLLPPADVTD